MATSLGEVMRNFRKDHVYDQDGEPRLRSAEDKKLMTQEEFADWVDISTKKVGDVENGRLTEEEIINKIMDKLNLAHEERSAYLTEFEAQKESRRSGRTLVFFSLPALHNSLFWTSVVASAVDPEQLPEGDPYYGVVPMCSGESLRRCVENLQFATKHHKSLAAVVVTPPAGLREEANRKDRWIERIEVLFRFFVERQIPVIVIDRHLPGGKTPDGKGDRSLSREPRAYDPGVIWIGPRDEEMAAEAARVLIEELTRRFGKEFAPIDRIAVLTDDVKLTPQDRRQHAATSVIERELENLNKPLVEGESRISSRLIKHGKIGYGSSDPNNPNYWGLEDRIKSMLYERPFGVICGSSQIARLVYHYAKKRADEDRTNNISSDKAHFIPVIISMDAAISKESETYKLQISHLNYSADELTRKIFDQIRGWDKLVEQWQGTGSWPKKEVLLGRVFINDIDELQNAVASLPNPPM